MKTKKLLIPAAAVALALIIGVSVFLLRDNLAPPAPTASSTDPSGPLPPVQYGDYIATDYPAALPVEAVSGVLGSLSAYSENILNAELTVASFLDVSYQNQILRLNITETGGEAMLVTKENAEAFDEASNPLRATRQLVNYANNSGHTINDLTITDEVSSVGEKDFAAYLTSATLTTGQNGAPDSYALSDAARAEIIQYCATMLAENRDTELYILSDNAIAFVMCERYSDTSLLGSFSFMQKVEDDKYLLRTVIDFNC